MGKKFSKIGEIDSAFDLFKLKEIFIKNDAGDWGEDPRDGAIGVIRSTNFTNQGLLDLSDVAYRSLKPNKLKEKKLYSGEILIERSGGSDIQPVGRVGYITEEIANDEFVFANFIQRIAIDDTIDYKFLFYCLQQMYEMGITASMQYQTTGIRNLDWKLYTKSFLPKPPKTEQRTIASILSRVDEVIATTKRIIAKAERLKKALIQNLLTGKLKPDGSWRKDDEFYMDEKFGSVPIGWKYDKLETTLSACQYGINATSVEGGKFPMFRMNNIVYGRMIAEPMVYINLDPKTFKKYRVDKNDILFNRTNSLDLVGKLGIFKLEGDYVFASYLIRLAVNDDNCPDFINYQLNSYKGQCNLRAKATPSVSQANINAGNVKKLIVLIPPKSEQKKIASKISSIENVICFKQTKVKKLERLKKALMQNLLTGKVRIKLAEEQLQTQTK